MTETILCSFHVHGSPVPQGSMKAVLSKSTKRAIVKCDRAKDLTVWRTQIAHAARASLRGRLPSQLPISVVVRFNLRPPKRPKWHAPIVRPDLDKLTRAVGDALTSIAYADDSQVIEWETSKRYADNGHPEGVEITVYEIQEV